MRAVGLCLVLVCCSVAKVLASTKEFSFASYYESNMVLQGHPGRAIVWGYAPLADIGSSVELNVTNALLNLRYKTYVKQGPSKDVAVWKVTLDPVQDAYPCIVTVSLKQYRVLFLDNVLFGDVWLCSGQSNMKLMMSQIINSSQEMEEAEKFSRIRFFSVGMVQSVTPLIDLNGIEIHWSVPNKENIAPFSAVCWLFAKYIYEKRRLPLGLVESSWGGTEIEAWSSPGCLKFCGVKRQSHGVFNGTSFDISPIIDDGDQSRIETKEMRQSVGAVPDFNGGEGPDGGGGGQGGGRGGGGGGDPSVLYFNGSRPSWSRKNLVHSSLWNAMVHPLLNMTIYGALWYQGESNSNYDMNLYNCTLPTMIGDWRRAWYEGTVGQTNATFPVGIVQLGPTSGPAVVAGFSDIRWHQTVDVGYLPNKKFPNTFLSVAYDLADPVGGIHFRDKITLSRRLALAGLAVAYGNTGLKYEGPAVSRYALDAVKFLLKLEYDNGKHPIVARTGKGFEVCCQNDSTGRCSLSGATDWSPAPVASWTNATVDISVAACHLQYLRGVRFAWRETPCDYRMALVYSVENDLPAPPFILRGLLGPVFGGEHTGR